MGFIDIYGTYMVFIVIIAVNPELDCDFIYFIGVCEGLSL